MRSRQDSTTAAAVSSPARTAAAMAAAGSRQSSAIVSLGPLGPALDLGHDQEAVEGGGRVAQEVRGRQGLPDFIATPAAGGEARFARRRSGGEFPQLVDVVDDAPQLGHEPGLLLRGQAEAGKHCDSPYFVDS